MQVTSHDLRREDECWPGVSLGQYWPRVATVTEKQPIAWYLTVHLGSKAANLLVDSGAQVSMMNKVIYDSLSTSYRPPLTSCVQPINAANGGQIVTYGLAKFKICVAGCSYDVEFIVADMGELLPGVLGMDFLEECDAILHCRTGQLELGGKVIFCHGRCPDGGGQVIVRESVSLPPGHVCYVDVDVQRWGKSSGVSDIIEPIADVCNMKGILMPRSVIATSCNSLTLEVTNVGGSEQTLATGSLLAHLDPVDMVLDKSDTNQSRLTDLPESPLTCAVTNDLSQGLPEHLQHLVEDAVELDGQQKVQVSNLLLKFAHCFEGGEYGLGKTDLVEHKIDTGDHNPIKIPPRRLGWSQRRALNEEVDKMLSKGVIEPSESPWSSPPVLVKKKDSTYRFCVDFRKVNGITRKDAYPLPNITDCLDSLSGAKWFCTLDLSSGYWQIGLKQQDRCKTAFTTPRGHYQFKVMPFGVTNGPATLERLMELVLRGMDSNQTLCYMDDVIVCGLNFEDTLKSLTEVFSRFSAAGLRLKPSKCELFRTQVAFLGHVVNREGVCPDPRKIEVIQKWPAPINVSEVRSFVGFASYYRKYVSNFSEMAAPLHALTRKDAKFAWSPQCHQSFEALKKALTSAPVLALPREGCQVILDTDASETAIGGVLSQIIDGEERVIAYASKSLNTSQRKYCTTYKELLAIVKMSKIFRPYLYGQPNVIVRTDHKALVWLQTFKNAEGMLARWLAYLSEYDFTIEHRAGKKHSNADGCSRIPVRSCQRHDCPDQSHVDKVIAAHITAWNATHGFPSKCREAQLPSTENTGDPSPSRTSKGLSEPLLISEAHTSASHQQRISNWMDTFSDAQLQSAQANDPDFKKVMDWVEKGERPSFEDISQAGSQLKNMWAQFNCLRLSNGKLVRICKLPSGEQIMQLVVPSELRRDIFDFLHKSNLGAHMGVNKTIAKLRRRFYWSGYRDDIIRWCQWCEKCQKRNASTQKRAQLQQKPVGMPLERVAIDILGPLPETENGNRVIMVVVDYFTKWTEAYALKDQKSMTVADAFITNFVLRFGCPLQLHSDQGSNFEAELFRDVCNLLGIFKTRTTAYRPESDGMVERMNRSLADMLAKLVNDDRSNWDEILPFVMAAYRNTPHDSTGITPNKLMLGRESDLPVDLMFGYELPDEQHCPVEYVEWVRDALVSSHKRARDELARAAQRQARHYNKMSGDPEYKIGDWVLLFYPPIANKKLGLKFLGPYKVIKKISEVTYEIEAHASKKHKVVHVNHLKPYLAEVLPSDLPHLPDLPAHLDLDGLLNDPMPQDPPTGILVDLGDDTVQHDSDQTPMLDLNDLFDESSIDDSQESTVTDQQESPALDPTAQPFVPKRSRKPPERYGHNVGHL